MNIHVKDPGSAITHFIGMMMAMFASTPLLIKAARQPDEIHIIALPQPLGMQLLSLVWGIALLGIVVKMFWITCPKWFSSILYISMGWTCVLAFTQLLNSLPAAAFGWLLAGGIIYTIGGVIYALKLPIFNGKHKFFGTHEIFHLFVMGGSVCHFIVMYVFVAGMPLRIF